MQRLATPPGDRAFHAEPTRVMGAQALLLSRACARHLLRQWETLSFHHDLRCALLAAQLGPLHYHTPSLVQHIGTASTGVAPRTPPSTSTPTSALEFGLKAAPLCKAAACLIRVRRLANTHMEVHAEPSLFQLLLQEGPLGLVVAVFMVTCTLWLLISRIRGCFRPQATNLGRDLAFLFAGPVSAILYAVMKAMVAAQTFVRGGFDAEFPLIYGLSVPTAFCGFAFLCFVLGVIACTLPAKSNAKVA